MSKGKLLLVTIVWLLVLLVGAGIWKLVFAPARDRAQQEAAEVERQKEEQRQKDLVRRSSSPSRYKHRVVLRLDSFSGYALLRSDEFRQRLAAREIDLQLVDDNADYPGRLQALTRGEADLAVFTIDALLKTSAEQGSTPGTIVALIDETTGADAVVAYRDTVPNIDSLNNSAARFVLTPDSPSETLARVVMSRFQLERLVDQPFERARDAEDVFQRYKQAKPSEPMAYVLWEPFVSKVLENPAMHVVVDSSRFPTTIVDCIVASRDFLVKNEDVVQAFVEAYLETVYQYRDNADLERLVSEDARKLGAPLSPEQAQRLVKGIWWKNTQENLAHFGLPAARRLTHLEDTIRNLTSILISTGGMERDPTSGRPQELYYRAVMEKLQNFHPGGETESIRDVQLPALTEQQWGTLQPVGTVRMPELVFARGTATLTERSRIILDELAVRLQTTRYYVLIRGNASSVGNAEANRMLAEQRARAAEQYLVQQGVDASRIRAVPGELGDSMSVSFSLGQTPY